MNDTPPVILIVDNYDSFTYNLVQMVREHGGCRFDVRKNDQVKTVDAEGYGGIIISPGPGLPSEVPALSELIENYAGSRSILGICLGHQAIAEKYGMKLRRLGSVRHGMETAIRVVDPSEYLFRGMPSGFKAGLYHSWETVFDETDPDPAPQLRVTAVSGEGIIMAISHTRFDVKGIQFHPESYISEGTGRIIHNWIDHLSAPAMRGSFSHD